MASKSQPPRSLLYAPGSNPRALEKAAGLSCDAVFIDLEDAVAPEAKESARAAAVAAVKGGAFGDRLTVIRCNHPDSEWGPEDWAAVCEAGPDGVLAPKIKTADDIGACDALLDAAPAHTRLWAMIETAASIMNLRYIARRADDTRLAALALGPNDLSLELRCRKSPGRAPLVPALAMTVAAARANGLWVFDGVFNDFSDATGFEAEANQAADLGFDGKTLIHPSQIDAANRAFSPTQADAAWARKVIAAFAAPQAAGMGAINLDGRMVERLHLVEAERILALAARSGR